MKRTEFDQFAHAYRARHAENIRASGEAPEYFADYKARDLARLLVGDSLRAPTIRILDFGSGTGAAVEHVKRHIPMGEITCADVSFESLRIGHARFGDSALFLAFDGKALPFSDGSFDSAIASCVFHHIPADEHIPLLSELRRILAADGLLLVYEHNPLNPLTRYAVNECPFDTNAVLIRPGSMKKSLHAAGFHRVDVRFRVFFPRPLAGLRPLERCLTWLPLGAQYYAAARKR